MVNDSTSECGIYDSSGPCIGTFFFSNVSCIAVEISLRFFRDRRSYLAILVEEQLSHALELLCQFNYIFFEECSWEMFRI